MLFFFSSFCMFFVFEGKLLAATAKWVFGTQVYFFPQMSINWFFLRNRRSSIQTVECEIKFWKDWVLVSTLILGRCGICIWGWWVPVQGLLMAVEKLHLMGFGLPCLSSPHLPWRVMDPSSALTSHPNMLHLVDQCDLKDILMMSAVISTWAGRSSCCFVAAPVWPESCWPQLPGWSHFLLKPASLAIGCSEVRRFYCVISDDGVGICIKLRCVACAGAGGVLGSIVWLPLLPVSRGGQGRHFCAPSTSCSCHLWREQMRVSCKYVCWKHLPGTLN